MAEAYRTAIVRSCVCALGLLAPACNEESAPMFNDPVDLSGDWTVTMTTTQDPCNRYTDQLAMDARTTQHDGSVEWQLEDRCEPRMGYRTGQPGYIAFNDTVYTTSDFDGCRYKIDSSLWIRVSEDVIEGGITQTATSLTDYGYGYLPGPPVRCPDRCDMQRTILGQRCQDCFDDCL